MAETGQTNRSMAASAAYGAGSFLAVVPSDTIPLPPGCRGLWVGTGGSVAVKGAFDAGPVVFTLVPSGFFLAGRFGYLMATGTVTAANFIAYLN